MWKAACFVACVGCNRSMALRSRYYSEGQQQRRGQRAEQSRMPAALQSGPKQQQQQQHRDHGTAQHASAGRQASGVVPTGRHHGTQSTARSLYRSDSPLFFDGVSGARSDVSLPGRPVPVRDILARFLSVVVFHTVFMSVSDGVCVCMCLCGPCPFDALLAPLCCRCLVGTDATDVGHRCRTRLPGGRAGPRHSL